MTTAGLVTAGVVLAGAVAWSVTAFIPESDAAAPSTALAAPIGRAPFAEDARLGSLGSLERGRIYYAQLCMPCHGVRGDGQGEWAYRVVPRPANLTGAHTQSRSDAELYDIVTDGRPATAMIGWRRQLSDAQRRQVVAYVRQLGVSREAGHE